MDSQNGRLGQSSVIRVSVANLAGVWREIVEQTIEQQADMRLLDRGLERVEVAAVGAEADVLVLGVDRVWPPPTVCHQLLSDCPHLKILVLANNGDGAAYWLSLQQHQLRGVSAKALVDSIRGVYALVPF